MVSKAAVIRVGEEKLVKFVHPRDLWPLMLAHSLVPPFTFTLGVIWARIDFSVMSTKNVAVNFPIKFSSEVHCHLPTAKIIFVNSWDRWASSSNTFYPSVSVDLTKSNEEVLTALRCSNRFMRVLNPGQFQQVWNFPCEDFPADVCGGWEREERSPDPPRPHPRWPGTRPISFVNTTTNSCNPIFSQDLTNAKCSAPKVEILILMKDICLASDQSPAKYLIW